MAQPISLEMPPRDARKELLTRLEHAPAAHAEALLDSYELLQTLHEAGVLEMVRGAVGAKDQMLESAVGAAQRHHLRKDDGVDESRADAVHCLSGGRDDGK